jgi:hypothetical protein
MSSIFDKYKATSTKTIKKLAETEDELTLTKRAGRLDLVDSVENKVRLGPKHPEEDTFMHMRACHWIKVEKDGQAGTRTVPNARLHGNLSKDPIEIYIDLVRDRLADGDPENLEKIKKITAWKGGMSLSTTWLSWAKKITKTERGPWVLWEYWRPVRDDLKNKMVIEDESEAIETDPFTHPLEGKCVLVTPSKAKKKTTINIATNPTKLTLEEMEAYDKLTPISRMPELNYSLADFELALEGIEFWDEAEDINLFQDEEFQEEIKVLRKELKANVKTGATTDAEDMDNDELPFEDDEKPKSSKAAKSAPKAAIKPKGSKPKPEPEPEEEELETEEGDDVAEEDEPDQFEAMTRKQLIAYKTEQGWDDVKCFTKNTDEEIREKVRTKYAEMNSDADGDGEVAEDVAEEEEDHIPVPAKKSTLTTGALGAGVGKKLDLDTIKAQLNKKTGKK